MQRTATVPYALEVKGSLAAQLKETQQAVFTGYAGWAHREPWSQSRLTECHCTGLLLDPFYQSYTLELWYVHPSPTQQGVWTSSDSLPL